MTAAPLNFVLTGMPRSGTTYLAAVLHGPPEVVALSEAQGRWKEAWRANAGPTEILEIVTEFRRRLEREDAMPTFDGTAGYAGTGRVDTWNQPKHDQALPVTESFALGVKNPEVFLDWLPQWRELGWPVVITVRHPIGVVNSWVRRGERRIKAGRSIEGTFSDGACATFTADGPNAPARRIALHNHFVDQILAVRDDPRVLVVRYEDWFDDPDQLRRIGAFLGIPVSDTPQPPPIEPDPPDALSDDEKVAIIRECECAAAFGYALGSDP